MSFKMRCPKCDGLDYSIERDNRTFGAVAQAFELVFHCRCGKQMFGEQILKEYEEQKKAWEADSTRDPAADDVPERRSQREAREQIEQVFEAKQAQEQAKAAPKPAPAKKAPAKAAKAASPTKASTAKKVPAKAAEPAVGAETCAWPSCDNARRKNSKYCSRACSNKNARYRHKLRAKQGDEGDEASS